MISVLVQNFWTLFDELRIGSVLGVFQFRSWNLKNLKSEVLLLWRTVRGTWLKHRTGHYGYPVTIIIHSIIRRRGSFPLTSPSHDSRLDFTHPLANNTSHVNDCLCSQGILGHRTSVLSIFLGLRTRKKIQSSEIFISTGKRSLGANNQLDSDPSENLVSKSPVSFITFKNCIQNPNTELL